MRHIIFVVILIGLTAPLRLFGATAHISVEPDTIVRVNEEVFFDATGSTDYADLDSGTFEWDFGDCYHLSGEEGGISATHFYSNPETYTVFLYITDEQGDRDTASVNITVEGTRPQLPPRSIEEPMLHLTFDNDLQDASGNNLHGQWLGSTGRYVPGKSGQAVDLADGTHVAVVDNGALAGMNEMTLSVWVRLKDSMGKGYVLEKSAGNSAYGIYMDASQRYLSINIRTQNGNRRIYTYGAQIRDTWWHHFIVRYDGTRIEAFMDGEEISSPVAQSGTVITADTLFIGNARDGSDAFDGYIEDLKIYDTALSDDDLVAFELLHANFHGRISQYLYAQIPGDITAVPTHKLRAVVTRDSDGGSYRNMVYEKNGPLESEEVFLFNNSALPGYTEGDYVFTTQLLNSADSVLDQVSEKLYKPYDGIPEVGLDENNAIRVNGEPFFPVTPYGLNNADIVRWGTNGYINTLFCQGFWPNTYTSDAWGTYLGVGDNYGCKAIGPTSWEGKIVGNYDRNSDVGYVKQYVNDNKNSNAMLAWNWADEPDLGGNSEYLPAPVYRSWTYQSHKNDPQHLTMVGFAGTTVAPDGAWWKTRRRKYCYLYNGNQFGNKTHVADIYGFDYYPFDWSPPNAYNGSMATLIECLDHMKEDVGVFVPFFSAVEVCDIDRDQTPWPPTAAQLEMITWINVIHGAKAIVWFQYFGPIPAENYTYMAKFVRQITELTPVVLGPETDREVIVSATGDADIDVMVREYEDTLFIFAVRVTEVDALGNSIGSAETANLSVSGLDALLADVYEEGRTVDIEGAEFTDTFGPNDVHIYKIPLNTEGLAREGKTNRSQVVVHKYPNPFVKRITFTYDALSVPGNDVVLKISDLNGQAVRTLTAPKNSTQLEWNGKDDTGKETGPGLYIYSLKAGPQSVTGNMFMLP